MKNIIFWTTIVYMASMLGLLLRVDRERQYLKNIAKELGYKENPVDRDKDGIIQEGTKWERKVSVKKF